MDYAQNLIIIGAGKIQVSKLQYATFIMRQIWSLFNFMLRIHLKRGIADKFRGHLSWTHHIEIQSNAYLLTIQPSLFRWILHLAFVCQGSQSAINDSSFCMPWSKTTVHVYPSPHGQLHLPKCWHAFSFQFDCKIIQYIQTYSW